MKRENEFINDIISKMSVEQKIGALLTLGFCGTIPRKHIYKAINEYHCGGLRLSPNTRLFGSYVDPKTGKTIVDVVNSLGYKTGILPPTITPSEYKDVLTELQDVAKSRPLGLPLHYSYDQEGGTSADYRFGGVNIYPKPMGIRASGNPELACDVAKCVSEQGLSVGFNWIHSPVLDVNSDPDNPEICTRAYSDIAEEVLKYAEQTCIGFKKAGMIATGKHFPGRGASSADAHFAIPVIDTDFETLWNRELLPYRGLIDKGLLPAIMIAHSIYPALDPDNVATVSKKILQDLLRDKMGFEGVITTDSMTMGGIAVRYGVPNACALALEAGADLVLMKAENSLVDDTFAEIKKFVETGRITQEMLDEKVYRVLNLKYEYGMFGNMYEKFTSPESYIKDEKIIACAKESGEKSVLILRNEENVIPLDKKSPVMVIEQMTNNPNNIHWFPGMLFDKCFKENQNTMYLETDFTYSDEDKKNIENAVKNFDTLIITSYYIRNKVANVGYIEELIRNNPDKKFVVVTNTPYPISVPKNAKNILLTLATSPENIKASAKILFGELEVTGEYPIEYKMTFEE